MSSAHLSPASIDFLQSALHSLKSAQVIDPGAACTDQLWSNLIVHDKEAYLANASCLHDGMNTLNQLRAARDTLSSLLSSLENAQNRLREATLPAVFARGIQSLPDEILSLILTYAWSSNWVGALLLSWVSRRFRAVALGTPRLWSSLPPARCDEIGHEALSAFLWRSKSVGLNVDLPLMVTGDYEQNPQWRGMLCMLMEHKHRWKEVSFDPVVLYETVQDDHNEESEIIKFPAATLDSVEHLNISDSLIRTAWTHYGADYDWFDDASEDMYEAWAFPNVRTLISEMHIPPPGVFPRLIEFSVDLSLHAPTSTITYGPGPEPNPSPLDALVDLLNNTDTLQSFKLFVGEYSYGLFEGSFNIPSLKKLHLENRYADPDALRTLRTVSRAMHIPFVEEITLSLVLSHANELVDKDGKGWLRSFFPETQPYNRLKHLRVEYTVENEPSLRVIKDFDRFFALEEVDICTASAPRITGNTAVSLHNSTSLQYLRFHDMHADRETAVREYTFQEECLPTLRSLSIAFYDNEYQYAMRQTMIYSLGQCYSCYYISVIYNIVMR